MLSGNFLQPFLGIDLSLVFVGLAAAAIGGSRGECDAV